MAEEVEPRYPLALLVSPTLYHAIERIAARHARGLEETAVTLLWSGVLARPLLGDPTGPRTSREP